VACGSQLESLTAQLLSFGLTLLENYLLHANFISEKFWQKT